MTAAPETGEQSPLPAEKQVQPLPAETPEVTPPAEPAQAEPQPAEPEEPVTAPETQAETEPAPAAEPTPEGPLTVGTRLLDRYEITELLSSGPEGYSYAANDLRRCPQCGYTGNEPGSEYCARCGAAQTKPVRTIIQQKPATGEPLIADQFTQGDDLFTVTLDKRTPTAPPKPAFPQGIRLRWGKKTDTGREREINEDYLDARVYSAYAGPTLGLFVVCDGVGGQEHGEVASQLATKTIWEQVLDKVWKPEMAGQPVEGEALKKAAVEAVQAANLAVYKLRREQHSDMGSTVTMALTRETHAVIANAGDSRTYVFGPDGLKRISVDHSVVEGLVQAGEITREQVYTHPQRSLIYRSLGDRPSVEVDTFEYELQPGDRLLLCSDGLWEMAREEGIEELLLREADPQVAADALVERANLAGGEDNITVIIVQVEG